MPSSAQVFQQLPYQKLSGYTYDVEDFEPYPCLPRPVPDPREPLVVPELDDDGGRSKRSFFYEPPEQKDDVYSVFKVPNRPPEPSPRTVPQGRIYFLSRKSG